MQSAVCSGSDHFGFWAVHAHVSGCTLEPQSAAPDQQLISRKKQGGAQLWVQAGWKEICGAMGERKSAEQPVFHHHASCRAKHHCPRVVQHVTSDVNHDDTQKPKNLMILCTVHTMLFPCDGRQKSWCVCMSCCIPSCHCGGLVMLQVAVRAINQTTEQKLKNTRDGRNSAFESCDVAGAVWGHMQPFAFFLLFVCHMFVGIRVVCWRATWSLSTGITP